MALRTILTPTRACTFEPADDTDIAPALDPISHVAQIYSHSAFGTYVVAHSEDTPITHLAVAADPGWLANARPTNIGDAVTQAFADAYRKRDER